MEEKLFKQPEPEYFTVRVEVMVPATLEYRILAESPEKALEEALRRRASHMSRAPLYAWGRLKKIKASVVNAGSSFIRLVKHF